MLVDLPVSVVAKGAVLVAAVERPLDAELEHPILLEGFWLDHITAYGVMVQSAGKDSYQGMPSGVPTGAGRVRRL
jgi:hypothetical protein